MIHAEAFAGAAFGVPRSVRRGQAERMRLIFGAVSVSRSSFRRRGWRGPSLMISGADRLGVVLVPVSVSVWRSAVSVHAGGASAAFVPLRAFSRRWCRWSRRRSPGLIFGRLAELVRGLG
jgi:hypothetical protein